MGFGSFGGTGGGGGAPKARSATTGATTTGPVYAIGRLLGSTSTLSLIAGTNSNLTLSGSNIVAAAGIGAGNSQVAVVREVNGQLAVEYPVMISGAIAVPAAPTLSITTGNAQVTLTWTDGANGGAAITAHKLYRGTSAGALTLLGTIMTGSPYVDTGLTNGLSYYYAISAVNSVGEGASSTVQSGAPAGTGPALNRLTWPDDGGYVFESSVSGTKVATIRDTTATSTLSIVSVTDSTGTAASNNLFAISGGDLTAGTVSLAYASSPWYAVAVRETHPTIGVKDTTLYVFVDKLTAQSTFLDDCAAADGTLLVSRTGWAANPSEAGDTTSRNGIAITGGAVHVTSGGASYGVRHQVSSPNYLLEATVRGSGSSPKLVAEFGANVGGGYVSVSLGSNRSIVVVKKTAGNTSTTLFTYARPADDVILDGDRVGIEIDRTTNTVYLNYRGARVSGLSTLGNISDIASNPYVGFGTWGSGVTGWDEITVTTIASFALDPMPQPIFCAGASGFGRVPVSGTHHTPPASLQWRLETDAGVLVPGYDWQTFPAVIGTTRFRGYLQVPAGGNYKIRLRDPADTSTVITGSVFGVGDVLYGYGQSNMVGLSETYAPGLDATGGRTWVNGSAAFVSPAATTAAGLLNSMVTLAGRPAAFINMAVSGQPLENLNMGTANYAAAIAELMKYRGRISAFLIDQGEANDKLNLDRPGWANGWNDVKLAFIARCGRRDSEVPGFMNYTKGTGTKTGNTSQGYINIRAAQKLFGELPYNAIAQHKFDTDWKTTDNIHQTSADRYTKVGPRFAWAIAKQRGLVTYDHSGPKILSGSRIGNVITLSTDLNGTTGLLAEAGTLAGFQFVSAAGYDGSQNAESYFGTPASTPPIAATITLSGNNIVATFASDPGPVALRYPCSQSAAFGGGADTFDGSEPFGQPYDVLGQTHAPQIYGNYADGSATGLAPVIQPMILL